MYIPQTMKSKIANTFYDKTVAIMDKQVVIDAEGGVTSKGLSVIDSFNGNVSFSNCKSIQEEYGLDYDIDISITTDVDTNVEIDNILEYGNVTYKVTDVLKSDSHILIVAIKWRQ